MEVLVDAGASNERSLTVAEVAPYFRAGSGGDAPRGVRLHDGDETVAFLEIDLPGDAIAAAETDLRTRAARITTLLRCVRLFAPYESAPSGTVLVVDDDEDIRSLLRKVLMRAGLEVHEAPDGRTALELAARERPDLILMDWQMPEMSGLEAVQLMQNDPLLRGIPVIMLTARSSKAERIVAVGAGVQDVIGKPFAIDEVIARVREELRWRRLLTSEVPTKPVVEPARAEVQGAEVVEREPVAPTTYADRIAQVEAEIARAERLAEEKHYSKAALAYKIAAENASKYTNPDIGNRLYRLSGKMYLNWAESAHDPVSIQRGYAGAARMFLGAGNLEIAKRSAEKAKMPVPAPAPAPAPPSNTPEPPPSRQSDPQDRWWEEVLGSDAPEPPPQERAAMVERLSRVGQPWSADLVERATRS